MPRSPTYGKNTIGESAAPLCQQITLIHRSGEYAAIAELKVWDVGESTHYPEGIKFSLFLVQPESGEIILGIDNHKPKGPHLHMDGREQPYSFKTIDQLIEDFWRHAAGKEYQP